MDRSCSARYVGYTGYWCYAADLHAHSMKPKSPSVGYSCLACNLW